MKWLSALVFILASVQPALAADESEFTQAEKVLFVQDHLSTLAMPSILQYDFERAGSLQEPLTGNARLELSGSAYKRSASVQFLSGADELKLPAFADIKGNPLILYFLEREIREMHRLTGGSMNYYRKRIRMALAMDPKVDAVNIEFDGRPVKATRITIEPYRDDPARVRYEKFADKTFVFVLSDDVPGVLLSMHSELKPAGSNEAVWTETLSYAGKQ